jgi:hypothetical protein
MQHLFFNEPWFIVEGVGFATMAWLVLGPGSAGRRWLGTALVKTSLLTVVGLLSGTRVIGGMTLL